MGFRDDREASVQRVEVLERELSASKQDLEAALLRAAEVDDLRRRIADLTRERDELKRGLDAGWSARNQRLRLVLGVVAVGVVGAIGVSVNVARRAEQNQIVMLARAQGDATAAEASVSGLRSQLATAQQELAQIDGVHADEMQSLQRQLNGARIHEAGHALLVTFRIRSRSGEVPSGVGDECVMAIRDVNHDEPTSYCVATVWCGTRQVFPFIEPSPDVRCLMSGAQPWVADGHASLALVNAQVSASSPPLLHYDVQTGVLDVRETGGPAFSLQMRMVDMFPYLLR